MIRLALFLSATAIACQPSRAPAPTTVGNPPPATSGAHQAPGVTEIQDEEGRTFQISQGVPGAPATVGCADGQREAFVDATAYPSIAGCLGEWEGTANMRAPHSGACGDDGSKCAAPGDVCAAGWRVCGETGAIADLSQVSGEQCEQAGGGRFVAAISHCKTQEGCEYDDAKTGSYQCFASGWCSEPVCCGSDCGEFGTCQSGVWKDKTHIPVGTDQGCGAIQSSRARGVLCCKS